MNRCINGHIVDSFEKCQTCGQPVDLASSLTHLNVLPRFESSWKSIVLLSVGFPPIADPNAVNFQVQNGEKPDETEFAFVSKTVSGETWSEVLAGNRSRFEKWIANTGFYKFKYKFVLVDTTDSLGVLTLLSLKNTQNLVVFAVSADDASNAMEQNASYISLSAIDKKKLPVILCLRKQIEDSPFCLEDTNLTVNTDIVTEVASWFISSLKDLTDAINKDLRLGIWSHLFSSVFSASNIVYPKAETIIAIQHKQIQQRTLMNDAQTAYLFARASAGFHEELTNAFEKQFSNSKTQLANKDVFLSEKQSKYNLYDIIMLMGTQSLDIKPIERGYSLIASKNADLKVKY